MTSKNIYADGCAWISGNFVPINEAAIPILDFGFLRSDATYDVIHLWNNAFFRLEDHLDRFERNITAMRLTLPVTRHEIRSILFECVNKSQLRNAYVEVGCTRGRPQKYTRDPRKCKNSFFAFSIPFVSYMSKKQRLNGLHIFVSNRERIQPSSIDPKIKNFHWIDLQLALLEAYDYGAENVILVDGFGNITEGPGFNVFCISNGVVKTPKKGVLDGITRRTVLEICAQFNIDSRTQDISVDELRESNEAFLTSTAGGIMPVTKINKKKLGDGNPGPITELLYKTYIQWHQDPKFITLLDSVNDMKKFS